MPRPATRTRILSTGAAAAATVTAVSLFISPVGDVDPLGSLGRANAASSAGPPAVASAFGVAGVDLGRLGYRGPALDAVTVATLSGPFPELPTERAADIRDRIAVAAPHLQSLHQAKNLLAKALPELDHHVHAAKVAVVAAEDAWARAKADLAAVRARVVPPVPLPDEGGPDQIAADDAVLASTPVGDDEQPAADLAEQAVDPVAPPGRPDPIEHAVAVIELARAEALVAHTNQARLAAWADLEARRERRRAHQAASAAAEHEVWRMDAHVRWLEYEQWRARPRSRPAERTEQHRQPQRPGVPVAGAARTVLRALQPAGRTVALEHHRPAIALRDTHRAPLRSPG